MLEQVDFKSPKLSKEDYKSMHNDLIEKLVVLQQKARLAEIGVVVLFEGWDGAGKGSRISDLLYNLDARATSVSVTENINLSEAEYFTDLSQGVSGFYPDMQEFWKELGPRGTMTIYDRGWYTRAIQRMLFALLGKDFGQVQDSFSKEKLTKQARLLQSRLKSAKEFEHQLTNEGYIVMKFFMHITEKRQKKRLTKLYENPSTKWRVSKEKLKRTKNYKQSYRLYDTLLKGSDFDFAPWIILNGEDKRRANLEIAAALVSALEVALEPYEDKTVAPRTASPSPQVQSPVMAKIALSAQQNAAPRESRFKQSKNTPNLNTVNHNLVLEYDDYRRQLKEEQERLNELELEMYLKRVPLMLMFEGWDAAGKGGAIKRIAQALDARSYTIFPSPAPTQTEKLHPYLWRYWTRLPKAGHVGIYDRSWYGRVLVERVEGFASNEEWALAYDEINGFEQDLINWGAILLKFWVDVSQDEQLRRFQARESDPRKQWKIGADDWRNREKYPQYRAAIEDMFRLTSTKIAPWTILESEDKRYARVRALQIINDTLETRLR